MQQDGHAIFGRHPDLGGIADILAVRESGLSMNDRFRYDANTTRGGTTFTFDRADSEHRKFFVPNAARNDDNGHHVGFVAHAMRNHRSQTCRIECLANDGIISQRVGAGTGFDEREKVSQQTRGGGQRKSCQVESGSSRGRGRRRTSNTLAMTGRKDARKHAPTRLAAATLD